MKSKEEKLDEEYLNQEFPKGKTKFRGQAMVLLALARKEGKSELINQWKSDIADAFDSGKVEGKSEALKIIDSIETQYPDDDGLPFDITATEFIEELKSKLQGEKLNGK